MQCMLGFLVLQACRTSKCMMRRMCECHELDKKSVSDINNCHRPKYGPNLLKIQVEEPDGLRGLKATMQTSFL